MDKDTQIGGELERLRAENFFLRQTLEIQMQVNEQMKGAVNVLSDALKNLAISKKQPAK